MADLAPGAHWPGLRLGEGPVRRALQRGLFPGLFVGCVAAASWLFQHFDPAQVGLAVYLGSIPLFFALERMLPWSEGWLGSRGDVHVDVGLILTSGLVAPAVQGATLVATAWAAGWVGQGLWPGTWPIVLQGALALVVADFFRYWVHRALHEWPVLWRVHATHHSSERLYFLNGARIHPLETLLSGVVESVPLALLGVSPEALAMRFVMGRVIGRFQHCNLDLRLGPLDYVFSTPTNHRWHHDRDLAVAAHNYGGDVILWDHVFGTFYLPRDRQPSDRVGIGNRPDFPRSLVGVLLSPFRGWRPRAEPGAQGAIR